MGSKEYSKDLIVDWNKFKSNLMGSNILRQMIILVEKNLLKTFKNEIKLKIIIVDIIVLIY